MKNKLAKVFSILFFFLAQVSLAQVSLSVISREDIRALEVVTLRHADQHGRVTEEMQEILLMFETKYRSQFDEGAAKAFQTLVAKLGARMNGPIAVPEIDTPYWLKDPGPLDNYRSSVALPKEVDYVVIGAGLTGAAAALELGSEAQKGKNVVVLEAGDRPAFGASGRNGGNIEMIKENFLNDYRGFVEVQKDILRSRYPMLTTEELNFQATRQSEYLLKFFQANVRHIQKTVREHNIQADVSMNGWLRVAASKEEEIGLIEEIEFAKKLGLDFEVWSTEKIKSIYGIVAKFAGRFIKESGNYHPFKYVNGVLTAALAKGVKLYTKATVNKVERQADGSYLVHTNDGIIKTKKIVVATNAYTRSIYPELDSMIEPRISHIVSVAHMENKLKGITFTANLGDFYVNAPKQDQYIDEKGVPRGTLHVGGGADTPISPTAIHNPPYMEATFHKLLKEMAVFFPGTAAVPPIASWSGVMGFTGDRAPILGFLHRKGEKHPERAVVFAVAFNGYGGSQSAISGKLAAQMAVTGENSAMLPEDLFSMERFLQDEPLFRRREVPICRKLLAM